MGISHCHQIAHLIAAAVAESYCDTQVQGGCGLRARQLSKGSPGASKKLGDTCKQSHTPVLSSPQLLLHVVCSRHLSNHASADKFKQTDFSRKPQARSAARNLGLCTVWNSLMSHFAEGMQVPLETRQACGLRWMALAHRPLQRC